MHVFIDTNILLNFFHFTKDEVDALSNVFATHQHGSATVHLTEQVRDEFMRNRENKIKDAIKKFKEVRFTAQLPSFMKSYEEYESIRKLSVELQRQAKSIMEKAEVDIAARNILADHLIKDIFENSQPVETTAAVFAAASMRMAIGNPPGKNSSIGDAINWTVLLSSVPDGEDLHVISEDGDFYSSLNENQAHPFLVDEWSRKKSSKLFVYRTLSSFLSTHFDGVAFSFDKAKDALIDDLAAAGGFSTTHHLIAKLENYSYFSLREVERILAAAVSNNQFGWIVTDNDVSDFLNRVAVPRLASIINTEQQEVIAKVIEEQVNRAKLNA
jgi:predicted nucleic acid-binding protein